MSQTTRRLLAALLWPALIGLILLALSLTALRLALPVADQYRDTLVQALAEKLGYPLRVGSMNLRMAGWSPRLVLDQVSLISPEGGDELLHLRALELNLDLIATLRAGEPQVRSLTLVGARLTVQRFADGRVQVVGLGALKPADPRTVEFFLRRGRLNLTESEVQIVDDDTLDGAAFRFSDLSLRLTNSGSVHQLELSARPLAAGATLDAGGPAEAQLQVLADLRGDAGDPRHWGGTVYLSLSAADLNAFVPRTLIDPDLQRAKGVRLESWSRLDVGALVQSLNRVGVREFRLGATAPPAPRAAGAATTVSLEQLEGLVRVTAEAGGWRVETAHLAFAVDRAAFPDLQIDARLSDQGRPRMVALTAAGFDLQAVARLLLAFRAQVPLDPGLVSALRPRGRVDQLTARIEIPSQGNPTWKARAAARGVGIDRHDRIPGLDGLNVRLAANQDGGELAMSSSGLDFDLRQVFDQPIHLDQVSGTLHWARGPDGAIHLSSQDLVLENADLAGQARLSLDLPAAGADRSVGPFIDLRAQLSDADIAQARHYLPFGLMKPELIDWLTRALVSGRVPQADLVLRGPLKHYPFRDQEGRFELLLGYQGLVLDYQAGWPRIEAGVGGLQFLNQGLGVWMDTGRVYDTAVADGWTAIPDLWAPHRMLIHGEGVGPFTDGLRVLTETPLAARLGPLARVLEVQGRSRVVLDLVLPLVKNGIMGVDGHLTWPEPAGLGLKGTPVTLTALAGQLDFTANAVRADTIRAQLWGQPVAISVATGAPGDPQSASTQILARSRTTVAELASRFPTSAWRLASGDLNWDLAVELRNADIEVPHPALHLSLRSDLRGVTLDLPEPLGKRADRTRRLDLTGALVPGRSLAIGGGLEGLGLDLALDLSGPTPHLEHGRVTVGAGSSASVTAPTRVLGQAPVEAAGPAKGLVIDGTVADLSLPAWTDWWGRVGPRLVAQTRRPSDLGLDPLSVDLRIAALDLGAARLTDARVQADPDGDGWDLSIDSKELAGRLRRPDARPATPWDLSLERLDLKAMIPAGSAAGGRSGATSTGRPPAADLRVGDLRWGEARLGRLSLGLRSDASGVQVSRLVFDGIGDTRVTGDADWLDSRTGGSSHLALTLNSADTGPLLRALDYSAALSAAAVMGRVRLTWPGGLAAFALAHSQGRIELDVGPGRLLDVDPGVGRVLGFLNLGELRRRLSLDFSDLYARGFVFERIQGRIDLSDGQARLETFAIDGPSSDIVVSGFADLSKRTYDQTVTVEPSIGTSVALASAVAGGPVVGAAVYLLDRVTGGAIDRLGSFQYRMTGPWAKPEFTRVDWEPFSKAGRAVNGVPATTGAAKKGRAAPVRPSVPSPAPRPGGPNLFLE